MRAVSEVNGTMKVMAKCAMEQERAHLRLSLIHIYLELCRKTLQGLNCSPGEIKSLSAPNGSARFFFVKDPDGYQIEVLERGGHYT